MTLLVRFLLAARSGFRSIADKLQSRYHSAIKSLRFRHQRSSVVDKPEKDDLSPQQLEAIRADLEEYGRSHGLTQEAAAESARLSVRILAGAEDDDLPLDRCDSSVYL